MASGTINLGHTGTTSNGGYLAGKIDWSSTSNVSQNQSTVTAKLYVRKEIADGIITIPSIGTWEYFLNVGGQTVSSAVASLSVTADWVLVAQKTATIAHNDNGAKSITIGGTVWGPSGTSYSGLNTTGSASVALDTIARKSTLTASNGTLGTAQTLTFNRASTSFTHSVRYECGTASGAVCTKVTGGSCSFTPPIGLASQNTTGTTVSVKLTLYTFSGDTEIGTHTKTITCAIPASVKPSCSITVTDANGYETTYGSPIKGLSKFKVTVTATQAYGSAITAYNTKANGATYTSASFTTNALAASGAQTIEATVTDKRSRIGTASATKTVLNYSPPNVSFLKVKRCDADGSDNEEGLYCQITFDAKTTSFSGAKKQNTAAYKLEYKKTTEQTFTSVTLSDYAGLFSVSDGTCVFEADSEFSYDVRVVATDAFGSRSKQTTLSTATTIIDLNDDGTGIAFGKVSEKSNAVELGWDLYDRFGSKIGNGMAAYSSDGIDPDTTLEPLILTNKNTPEGVFHYIETKFYGAKSVTTNRVQIAYPYSSPVVSAHMRRFYDGAWTGWGPVTLTGGFDFHGPYVDIYASVADAINGASYKAWLGFSSATSNDLTIRNAASGAIDITTAGSSIRFAVAGTYRTAMLSDRFRPTTSDQQYLGDSTYKWKAVYAVSGAIQTSDRNQKTNINEIEQRYIDLFDRLSPVTFEFNDAESDRVHIGFISQDVKAAMDEVGISALEFAGYCRDVMTEYNEETQTDEIVVDESGDPVYLHSLRYSEFIALNSKIIQLNRQKIAEQQAEIDRLRSDIEALKSAVEALTK